MLLRTSSNLAFFLAAILLAPAQLSAQAVEEHTSEHLTASSPSKPGGQVQAGDTVSQIIEQTNAFRKQEGLRSVQGDPRLMETAQYFADYMARTDEFGHHADGNRPADRVKKFAYDYCIVLENIAYQYSSAGFSSEQLARRFVQGWKDSQGHRRNMLDPDVTETGVAIARSDKSGYWYAVQMFGRPRSQSIRVRISNTTDQTIHYDVGDRSFTLEPSYIRVHEECRPPSLTFRTGSDDDAETIATRKIEDNARLVIRRQEGQLQVIKE